MLSGIMGNAKAMTPVLGISKAQMIVNVFSAGWNPASTSAKMDFKTV